MGTTKLALLMLCAVVVYCADSDGCGKEEARAPYCCDGKLVSEIVTTVKVDGVCKYEYKTKSEIINCQKKPDKRGRCGANGIAIDRIYSTEVDKDCKCVDKYRDEPRTCKCQSSSTIKTCNPGLGLEETVVTKYKLMPGPYEYLCQAVVIRSGRTITFDAESTETGNCNDDGFQLIVTTNRALDRDCNVVVTQRNDTRACACSKTGRTVEHCLGNSIVTKKYTNILDCCECSCKCTETLETFEQATVVCPEPSVVIGDCGSADKKRKITDISYSLDGCKCTKHQKYRYEDCQSCKYEVLNKTVIYPCCDCKNTETIEIVYRDTDCNIKRNTEEVPCSCPQAERSESICQDGIKIKTVFSNYFNKESRACEKKVRKYIKPTLCKHNRVKYGRCVGEGKKYRKKTTVEYSVDLRTCKCVENKKVERIICKCPPEEHSDWKCQRNNHRVKTITSYVINYLRNDCDEKIATEDIMVHCNKPRSDTTIHVNHCLSEKRRYFSIVENCQCKHSMHLEEKRTCCTDLPQLETTKKCVDDDTFVTVRREYKLSCDKKTCAILKFESQQKIKCRVYEKTFKSRCKQGRFYTISKKYGVKNCKCVLLKRRRIPIEIPCDLKKVVRKKRCVDNNAWITTTTTWSIDNCQCVSRSTEEKKVLGCALPIETRSRCNRKTGLVTIDTKYEELVNCRCVTRKKSETVKCPCLAPDRIERGTCFGKKRIVQQLRRHEVNKKCLWRVRKTESEDCGVCCRSRTTVACVNNVRISTTISHDRQLHYLKLPVMRCVASKVSKTLPIVCKKSYMYLSPCKNFKQSIVKCTYKIYNCECMEVCKTKCVRACNCRAKNECATKCIGNEFHRICHHYADNGAGCGCGCHRTVSECAKSTTVQRLPVTCVQPCPRRTCSECTISRNHGYYKKCTYLSRVNIQCKCELKRKVKEVLCRCRSRCSRSFCRSNRVVVRTTMYERKHNECVPHTTEFENHEIVCPRSYIITKDRACSTDYTLVYFDKENCKCVEKRRIKSNDKCCKKSFVDKSCAEKDWLFTEHSWVQQRTAQKLFNEISDSPMTTFCNHVIKRTKEPILCRADSYTKWCNIVTKRLKIVRHYCVIVNCNKVTRTAESEEPCNPCDKRKKKERRGKCDDRNLDEIGFLDLTTTTYQVTETNTCKTHISHTKEVCRCPRPRQKDVCQHGRIIHQKISFILRSNPPCRQQICTTSRPIHCYNGGKPNKWRLGKIERCRHPNEYTIANYDRERFTNCACVKESKRERKGICCKPCRSFRRCIANQHAHITICERAVGLKCVKIKSIRKSHVCCPKPVKHLIGLPHKCVQKYTLIRSVNINCRCVKKTSRVHSEMTCCIPKTTVSRKCLGARWRVTTTTYELEHGQCKPYVDISYEDMCTCQLDDVTFKDKDLSECTFERSYFKKKIVNCKYVEYFTHKEILKSCCRKRKVKTSCQNNRIQVTTLHYFRLCHYHCIPKSRRTLKSVDCSHLVLQERVSNGPCKYKDTYYKVVYNNCKCERQIVKIDTSRRSGCCHKKPYSTVRCDERKGVIVTTSYTYRYDRRNERCIRCTHSKSVKVNCNRRDCYNKVAPCKENRNIVTLFCQRRNKCRCVTKAVEQRNQCCKPPYYEWTIIGPCNASRCYKKIKYFAFRMDAERKHCKPTVIRVIKKLCCCDKKQRLVGPCENDTYRKITIITHTLNREETVCVRSSRQRIKHTIGCCRNQRKVRVVSRHCDRRSGWARITTEYVQAKNCKCVTSLKVRRCPCVCRVAFPTTVRKYCRNNRLVTETRRAVCSGCRVRWTTCSASIAITNCAKIVEEKGPCFTARDGYAISIRYISKIQYLSINCKCVRKEISKWQVHCVCRKPTVHKRCQTSQILITTHDYLRKKGICRRVTKRQIVKIPCLTKPMVTLTMCKNNKYEIVTTTFYHGACKCLSNRSVRKCDCKCPPNSLQRRCTGKYLMEVISTTWTIVHCRCVRRETRRKYSPRCPHYAKVSIGPCVKKGNKGYKQVIHRHLTKRCDVCKCFVKEVVKPKLCWCKEKIKTTTFCQNNNVVITQISKKLLCKRTNQCHRRIVKSSAVLLKPRNPIVTEYCNRENGRYFRKTVSFHYVNCKLKPCSVTTKIGRCWCPKKQIKIKGTCRPNNFRTYTYIHEELKNRKCVKVEVKKEKICRCPLGHSETICKNNAWHTVLTTYKLSHHKCIEKQLTTIKHILCLDNEIVEKGPCNSSGYKVIKKYKYFNRNCHCVKEKIKEFRCKCRCCKPHTKYHCDKNARIRTKTVTSFFVQGCKCRSKQDVTKVGIPCPGKKIVISPCSPVPGKDFSIITTATTTYSVNDKCKCVQNIDSKSRICTCPRKEKKRRLCDKIRHVMIWKTSYTELRNNACVRIRRIQHKSVCCGSGKWALKGDSGCIADNHFGRRLLTYVRQRPLGCRCKEDTLKKVCNCLCNGPAQRSQCCKCGSQLVHTYYKYKMIGCKCVVTKRVEVERIKCCKLRPIVQQCRLYRDGIYRKYTIHRDRTVHYCRCQIIERPTWVICKCPKESMVETCDRYKNVFVITHTWYKLTPKKCIKHTETTYKPVACDTTPDCTPIRRCTGRRKDRQMHRCIFRSLSNCQCKEVVKTLEQSCPCGKRKDIELNKNKHTCMKTIATTRYYLHVFRNNKTICVPKTTEKEKRWCCPDNPPDRVTCRKNRLIKTSVSITFNPKCKTCHRTVRRINITPKCCPSIRKTKTECTKATGYRYKIHITLKSLVDCKCRIQRLVRVKLCKCPTPTITRECSNERIWKITTHSFTLTHGRCPRKTSVTHETLPCNKNYDFYETLCNAISMTRVRVWVSHTLRNCKVVKTETRRDEICDCPKPWSKEVCDSRRGVFVKTDISYSLDTVSHVCVKSEKSSERRPCCDTKPHKRCQSCIISYHCGTYKRCTTSRGSMIGCSCAYRSNSHFELCTCPKSRSYRRCIGGNVNVKIVIFYIRVRSQSKCHDFECKQKSKIVERRIVKCGHRIIKKGECIRRWRIYTFYTFASVNCVCVMRVKIVRDRCRCQEPKEVSHTCSNNVERVVVRSWKLVCDFRRRIPRCRCIHMDFRRDIPTICPRKHHRIEKCIGNKRKIVFIKYVARNCKCERVERPIFVDCDECKSEMHYCGKIKAMGLCRNAFYRQYLCQFTCEYCEPCPKKCATKHIGQCRCKNLSGVKICARKTEFSTFRIVHRKCVEHKSVKYSLCSCSLEYSHSKCEQLKKAGRCKEIKVMKRCQFVCAPSCHLCQGSVVKRRCVQEGPHKATHHVETVTFRRVCNSCITEYKSTHTGRCTVCSLHRRFVVTECIHGNRYVLTQFVKKEGRRCVNKETRVPHSCRGCCKWTETKIGDCSKERRTVVTVFWVNVNNCCKKMTAVNVYSCNSRSKSVMTIVSGCINGKQIHSRYFLSGKSSTRHFVTEMRSCIPK